MKQLIFIILFLLVASPAFAQEPSPETKAKIEEIKRGVASKAAELKQEVNQSLQNKAFVGKTSTVSTNSLTLTTLTGAKIVSINQDTVYEGIKKASIKEGIYLAALGDIDDTGVLTAKKVVGLSEEEQELKEILIGKVTAADPNEISIQEQGGHITKVKIDKKTVLKYGSKNISAADIRVNLEVVATGFKEEEEILGSTIFVTTEAEIENPEATPSAKSATSSSKKL